jgi:glucose uptake protein GlcU
MPEQPGKPTLGQVYRQQYQEVSSSKTSRAFRIISPLFLLICAIFLRHWRLAPIILGAAAVLIFAVAIILTLKRRHANPTRPESEG